MQPFNLRAVLDAYDSSAALETAQTPPSAWYTREEIFALECERVFRRHWVVVGAADRLLHTGDFVTAHVAGEPVVVVRGTDGQLRAFLNVCRHHAAEVATEPAGNVSALRCPYHGWTYGLDGALRTMPEFDGVCDFDKSCHGLIPVRVETWESFVFICMGDAPAELGGFLGDLVSRVAPLGLSSLRWVDRKSFTIDCNWKIFVDNYLDGGYHIPFIHKGLGSILSYKDYTIENGERYCEQASPITHAGGEAETAAVRGGDKAYYYWLYPNFMFNCYEGYMDTHIVLPIAVNRCEVIFDFYFADIGEDADEARKRSVAIAQRIQGEDIGICESVQRGLSSTAYDTGRLSVRREAGEHLFHRLLHADLTHAGQA